MKRFMWFFLITVLLSLPTKGQEGNYYYGSNSKPVQSEEDARMLKKVTKRSEKKYIIKTYLKQRDLWTISMKEKIRVRGITAQKISYKSDTFFPRRINREMEQIGQDIYRFEESNQQSTLRSGTSTGFLPLHLEGPVTEYHKNGRIKSISIYQDNQLISNENWLSDGSKYIDSIFYSVDKDPVYHKDDHFFKSYLIRKLIEAEINLEEIDDDVIIGFVIMETGQIQGVYTLQGRSLEFNQFLESAIANLPGEWIPAMLNGSPVRHFMSIPLNFQHNDPSFQDLDMSSGRLNYNIY